MTVGPPDPCLGRRKGVARPTAPTPRGNRAAIYARVSTSQQVDGTSLPTQLAECDATASRRDLTVVDKFVDAGRSGADASRPELDRMLMAREGLIDVILVAKLDRLGRSLLHLLSLLVELDALSVQVVSISEGFDTSTAVGRLQLSILGSVTEFERERTRERILSGLHARAEDEGFVSSRPPFGYRAVPDPRGRGLVLEIDPDQAATVRRALVVPTFAPPRLRHAVGGGPTGSRRPRPRGRTVHVGPWLSHRPCELGRVTDRLGEPRGPGR